MVEAANNSNKSVRMTGHGPEPHCFAHMVRSFGSQLIRFLLSLLCLPVA
jgi:hypothetical protein